MARITDENLWDRTFDNGDPIVVFLDDGRFLKGFLVDASPEELQIKLTRNSKHVWSFKWPHVLFAGTEDFPMWSVMDVQAVDGQYGVASRSKVLRVLQGHPSGSFLHLRGEKPQVPVKEPITEDPPKVVRFPVDRPDLSSWKYAGRGGHPVEFQVDEILLVNRGLSKPLFHETLVMGTPGTRGLWFDLAAIYEFEAQVARALEVA